MTLGGFNKNREPAYITRITPEKLRLSEMTKILPISLYLVPEIYQQCYNIVIGYLKTDKIPQKIMQ